MRLFLQALVVIAFAAYIRGFIVPIFTGGGIDLMYLFALYGLCASAFGIAALSGRYRPETVRGMVPGLVLLFFSTGIQWLYFGNPL